jgi:KDO2-lipid IV(A) lauroyltransferase
MNSFEQTILSAPVTNWGRWLYHFLPYRKKVVEGNIELVFGDKVSPSAKTHLAKAFYSHLAKIIAETFSLRFLSEKQLMDKVSIEGYEHLLAAADKGKGALILTGHFGNWEFAPLGGMPQFKQFNGSFHFIRRQLAFKSLEKLLFKRYHRAGLKVIPKKNALDKILAVLEQNHAVVFVLDQHASLANKDGVAVDFFGKKAGTYRSLAMVAKYAQVPVIPAAGYRTADNRHVLKFYPPLSLLEPKANENVIEINTRQYNEVLETIILQHPEQWWWLHKRWKLKTS